MCSQAATHDRENSTNVLIGFVFTARDVRFIREVILPFRPKTLPIKAWESVTLQQE